MNITQSLWTTEILHQIDLTGAEFKYGENCFKILNGRLGRVNPETSLTNGHLSVISQVKPNLFLGRARIGWQNLEFELMMISMQELTLQAELKLKFIARLIPPETNARSL